MTAQQNVQLKDVKVSVIRPAHERRADHGKEIFYPTALDSSFKDIYMATVFAYRLADDSSEEHERFLNRLKTSLENVQTLFFPFAGRWLPGESHGRRLVCNDEGIPFVECAVEQDVDSVVRTSGELCAVHGLHGYEALGMDPSSLRQAMRPEGLPPIFFQVTRFRCGGVVLGATFNHMTVDATSLCDFMVSWAEFARTNQVTIKPNFDRSLAETSFKIHEAPKSLVQTENLNATSTTSGVSKPEEEVPNHDQKHSSEAPIGLLSASAWTTKYYEVNRGMVQAMKSAVPLQEREKGAFISTGDCIVSQAWKSLLQLPDSILDKSNVTVQSVVEGRLRFFETPLPNLFGNVFSLISYPKVSLKELLEEPAHVTAQRLRAKLAGMKLEDWGPAERMKEMQEASSGSWLSFSSWYRHPLYDIDFGVGGRPYYAPGPSFLQMEDTVASFIGYIIIAPPVPSHASSAATTTWICQSHILEALEASPDFMAFFMR